MNDLETRLRDALVQHVARTEIPPMPPRAMRRIRLHQVLNGAMVGVALAVAGIAIITLLGTPSSAPRSSPPAAGRGPTSVIEVVPDGWPTVDVLDPTLAYRPAQHLARHVDPIHVVASGVVQGHTFSLLAWTGRADAGDPGPVGPCLLFAGPGPPASGGGGGGPVALTCAHTQNPPVPDAADLSLFTQQNVAATGVGANSGFVSPRVLRLDVVLEDGSRHPIELLDGPSGWDGVRTFLFFPPQVSGGILQAIDGGGRILADAPICVFESGFSGSCGGPARQLVEVAERR
jgi:hypothetical protein